MKTLELYLVRHGKTVFNTTGRLQGWSDSPLTPEGCQVAENLGRGLERSASPSMPLSAAPARAPSTPPG